MDMPCRARVAFIQPVTESFLGATPKGSKFQWHRDWSFRGRGGGVVLIGRGEGLAGSCKEVVRTPEKQMEAGAWQRRGRWKDWILKRNTKLMKTN